MIRWLSGKQPDVWFEIAPLLNWDNALPVLHWIVSQPNCDRAIAADIFWSADPAYFARRLADGESPDLEGWELVEAILKAWRSGFYRRSELGWPGRDAKTRMAYYEAEMRKQPAARDALPIPLDLFGPLHGRKPRVPSSIMPGENVEAWDLLAKLGTHVGYRPGSDQWRASPEARWRPSREPGLLARSFGKPHWSPAAIFWLGLSVLLLILVILDRLRA